MISGYEKYEPFFGVWKIKRKIGEGSFGKVFEIEREEYGAKYSSALKIISIPQNEKSINMIRSEITKADAVMYYQELVQRVIKETEVMAKLKGNSNIVSYEDHQIIEHPDGIGCDILIRMELLIPLKEYMMVHVFSEKDAIKMGIDIGNALELCRMKNIIHRDIKPENIFVSENGNYKLGDFGIAKNLEETNRDFLKQGTYSYMAPEVYKGEDYGTDSDIYSLGLVLYRIFNNNRMPFTPEFPSLVTYEDKSEALKKRILGEKLQPPVNAGEKVWKVIQKACTYEKKNRYKSATEFKNDLNKLLINADHTIDLLIVSKSNTYNSHMDERTVSECDNEPTVAEENELIIQQKPLGAFCDTDIEENDEKGVIERIISEEFSEKSHRKLGIWKLLTIILCIAIITGGITFYLNRKVTVPDITGMTQDEAKKELEGNGLNLEVKEVYNADIETGKVISQDIKQGQKVKNESTIEAQISLGKKMTEIRNYVGMDETSAKNQAEENGITLNIAEEYSDEIEKGNIISQKIEAGTKVEEGSSLDIVVSKGIETVIMPDFSGMSQSQVVNLCNEKGVEATFIWDNSNNIEKGYVIQQDVAANIEVKKGSSVMVTLSEGAEEKDATSKVSEKQEASSYSGNSDTNSSTAQPSGTMTTTELAQSNDQATENQTQSEDSEQQEQDKLEDALNQME